MSKITPTTLKALPDDFAQKAAKRAQAKWFRSQIALPWKRHPYGKHRIFLETYVPNWRSTFNCRYEFCSNKGNSRGRYCIAIWPPIPRTDEEIQKWEDGVSRQDRHESPAEFYHVECFSSLVDIFDMAVCHQMHALTRHTWSIAGYRDAHDTNSYLLDSGAKRLFEEWKLKTRLIRTQSALDLYPPLHSLFYQAGHPDFHYHVIPGDMRLTEQALLATVLAPWEKQRPGDNKNGPLWNLFDQYLLFDGPLPHPANTVPDLVKSLDKWENDIKNIHEHPDDALRAISRLLTVIPYRERAGSTYQDSSIVYIAFKPYSNHTTTAPRPN